MAPAHSSSKLHCDLQREFHGQQLQFVIMQAAVAVADSGPCAELLTQASRQMLVEMVYLLFQRIGDLPDTTAAPGATATHAARLQVNSEATPAAGTTHPLML